MSPPHVEKTVLFHVAGGIGSGTMLLFMKRILCLSLGAVVQKTGYNKLARSFPKHCLCDRYSTLCRT